jgi:hypothetical protein
LASKAAKNKAPRGRGDGFGFNTGKSRYPALVTTPPHQHSKAKKSPTIEGRWVGLKAAQLEHSFGNKKPREGEALDSILVDFK